MDAACLVNKIPVAIYCVVDVGNNTSHTVSLAVGASDDLGTSCILHGGKTLNNVDVLSAAGTLDVELGRTTIVISGSAESDLAVTIATLGAYSKPLGNLFLIKAPSALSMDVDSGLTTVDADGHVGPRHLNLVEQCCRVVVGAANHHSTYQCYKCGNKIS